MAGSAPPRSVIWLAGGVLATVCAAIVDDMGGDRAIALLAGSLVALATGIAAGPIRSALTVRPHRPRMVRSPSDLADHVRQRGHTGEGHHKTDDLEWVPSEQHYRRRGDD